jgi:hypothetical protein
VSFPGQKRSFFNKVERESAWRTGTKTVEPRSRAHRWDSGAHQTFSSAAVKAPN